MSITKYTTFFVSLAVVMVLISIFAVSHYGIKRGVDFTGGTVVEISYQGDALKLLNAPSFAQSDVKVYQTGTSTYKLISTASYAEVSTLLVSAVGTNTYTEMEANTVGPTLGKEMETKAMIAIVCVVLAILAFIAFSFRHVSEPVASWKYGLMAIVTLLHDIIVPTGVYVYLSQKYGVEVDTLFVVALLTIMAISISDKIVVFDRIRENLKLGGKKPFKDVVDISLRQTFTRSINTSVTVVLALAALYFFGPVTTKFFALTLITGMIVGTYSSIFVASPFLRCGIRVSKILVYMQKPPRRGGFCYTVFI